MTAKLGPKGQVVIPKAIRERLGLEPGDEVAFTFADGGVLVEPVSDRGSLKGRFAESGMLRALEAQHAEEVARGR